MNVRVVQLLLSFGVICILTGCSTIVNSHRQKASMMQEYVLGENEKVAERINDKLDKSSWTSVVNTGDEIMWRLEAGSINFHLGKFKQSIDEFKIAEKLIAEYDRRAVISVRDVGSEAGAALSNMNVLPYRGFCRDRIALSIFKSIAYLGIDKESSFRAQLRRLRNEQKKVQRDYRDFFDAEKAELRKAKAQNAKVARSKNVDISPEQLAANPQNAAWANELKNVSEIAHKGYRDFLNPAAIFLSGLGSLRDGNFDNARIDFKRLYEAMPGNPLMRKYYVTMLRKTNRRIPSELKQVAPFAFPLDRNCVYVIFANGRGAAFKQISIYYPIMTAWPVCEFYPSVFKNFQVVADSTAYSAYSLANMDAIIAREFKERLPGIITRIILSTAIKEAAYHTALAAANAISDSRARAIALISVAAAGTAYRIATNTADTRSWELLPKEFHLTQFPMPVNRTLSVKLDGNISREINVQLPRKAGSAIIYISALNEKNIKHYVFPLNSDGDKFYEPPIKEETAPVIIRTAGISAVSGAAGSNAVSEQAADEARRKAVELNSFIQKSKQRFRKQANERLAGQKHAQQELERIIVCNEHGTTRVEKRIFIMTKAAVKYAKSKSMPKFYKALSFIRKQDPNHKNISLLVTAYGSPLCAVAREFMTKRKYELAVRSFAEVYPFLAAADMFIYAFCLEKTGNYSKALTCYVDALNGGHSQASLSIANIYLSKQHGHYNEEEGINYLKMAAESGIPVAQYKLGCIYGNFPASTYSCVPYNRAMAEKWLSKAVDNGFFPARSALRRLK